MKKRSKILIAAYQIFHRETYRTISNSSSLSNETIKNLKMQIQQKNLTFDAMEAMDDQELISLAYNLPPASGKEAGLPDFEAIYQRLSNRKNHATLQQEWEAYHNLCPDGYKRSWFYTLYHRWEEQTHPGRDATAPIERRPGEFMYIDWAGDKVRMVQNPDNPIKPFKAHFFVTTLGASSLTFACALPDEKTSSMIEGMARALEYYDALPRYFCPDNMKTAVQSHTGDSVILSTAMEDLQRYYDTPVLPARPYKPKDKATVERAVKIVETEIIYPLSKEELFTSFEELNKKVALFIERINNRHKRDLGMSRRDFYEKFEYPVMRDLPGLLYACPEYCIRKVGKNCHIEYKGHCYSVPFTYVDQTVVVKTSDKAIMICNSNNEQIALHPRSFDPRNRYVTNENHLKSSHQFMRKTMDMEIEDYHQKAQEIGPAVDQLISILFSLVDYPEHAFAACRKILHSAKKYPSNKAEKAARICIENEKFDAASYRAVLKEAAESSNTTKDRNKELPEHGNTRGREDYR